MKHLLSFTEIYSQYGKMVYNVSLNYLQNLEDAEEATQDVFVKIHEKIEGFNQKSSLKTWIYRITINHCLDVIKSKNRRMRVLFSRQNEEHDSIEFNHPGVALESKEAIGDIMKALNHLPPNQKTAIVLKSIEGLSQKEIAEIMELKEKAVESLLTRARVNLKTKLKP
ncbi:MAG: RNA polymerase sigma factor [Flavobacteriales bacterium]|jgi:RNA polymerase sigma factor (sigma-70 family)